MAKLAYTKAPDRVTQLATTTLAAGTAVSGYDVDRLSNLDPSHPLWIEETSIDLRLQFPSPQRLDWCSLHHTNLTVPMTLMGNTSDSWGTPLVSLTIAAPAANEDGFYSQVGVDVAAAVPVEADRTLAWWRLFNASANANPIRIGELAMFSVLRRLQRNVKWELTRPESHGVSTVSGKKGPRYIHKRRTRERSVLADLPWATDAGYAEILSWRRGAFGMADPFIVVPAGTDADEPLLVRFRSPGHEPVLEFIDLNVLRLEFEELSCGEAY